MSRLTDTQLVILSAAAQREEGTLLPLPASLSLNKGAARVVFESLLKRGLVLERPAQRGEEAWRAVEDVRQTLVITDAGLEAIGVESGNTDIASEGAECAANASARPEAGSSTIHDPGTGLAAAGTEKANITPTVRPGTKLACLIDLMEREEGVTIAEVVEAIVLEREVVYRGQSFRSLSAVAREITGTPWSGPAFFGLKERANGKR